MKNKRLKLVALFLLGTGILGLYSQPMLSIRNKSGTEISFALNAIRKLTFPAANMQMYNATGTSATFWLNSISSMGFENFSTDFPSVESRATHLLLYQNPVKDRMKFTYNANNDGNVLATIVDLQGRVLFESTLISHNGINSAEFPVEKLASGIYLLFLRNSIIYETSKVIKL